MGWRDVESVPNELSGDEAQSQNVKIAALVKRIRAENPDWRPHGLTGETECPLCGSVVSFSILSGGSVYADCATMGCFTLRSRPSADDLRRPKRPDLRRRLL